MRLGLLSVIVVIATTSSRWPSAVGQALRSNRGLASDALHEICNMETFRPQCWRNEVVVISKALYGRRHTGRCLNVEDQNLIQNPRYLGCSADVTDLVAAKCSGKKQCEIRIPDSDLEQTKPCLNDLKLFLEVSYTCVEVVEDRSCLISISSSPLHIARPTPSTAFQSDTGLQCGTRTQPWLLEAPAGQKINISLIDFAPTVTASSAGLVANPRGRDSPRTGQTAASANASNLYSCQYGYVIDKSMDNKRNISVCGGGGAQHVTNVYMSSANMVELVLPPNMQLNYLLRMQAVGCADFVPPEDAWVQRDDNRIVIGCFTSRQTWQLRCQDGKWTGVISNCSHYHSLTQLPLDAVLMDDSSPTAIKNYEVATVVAISFLCLLVSVLIICGGVVCWYRFYANIGANSLGVYRFKYRCVGLPKTSGVYNNSSTRDIEMSVVETSKNRYENLIYGSSSIPDSQVSAASAVTMKLTPVLGRVFNKSNSSATFISS